MRRRLLVASILLGSAVLAELMAMPYREFADDVRVHLKSVGRPATGLAVHPISPP